MDKIIISDTSCLIALKKADLLFVLHELYGQITITDEVKREFGESLPEWFVLLNCENKEILKSLEEKLDPGEASSIALSIEHTGSLLIIDEYKGRKVALSLSLQIVGTIGILALAEKRGIINNLKDSVIKITNAGFRISDSLLNLILNK